jgi:hypothetical protein
LLEQAPVGFSNSCNATGIEQQLQQQRLDLQQQYWQEQQRSARQCSWQQQQQLRLCLHRRRQKLWQ